MLLLITPYSTFSYSYLNKKKNFKRNKSLHFNPIKKSHDPIYELYFNTDIKCYSRITFLSKSKQNSRISSSKINSNRLKNSSQYSPFNSKSTKLTFITNNLARKTELNAINGSKLITTESENLMTGEDPFTKYSGYVMDAFADNLIFSDEYDPVTLQKYFQNRYYLVFRRSFQIFFTLGRWFLFRWLDSTLGRSNSMFKQRASELRSYLVQLGPAFVKVAQAVSSRPDLISPEYIEELSLLQDRISPFSSYEAFEIIENELNIKMESLFSEISPFPVAAASLGQVYEGRLKSNNQKIAVKVQRKGVLEIISLDIFILRFLVGYVKNIFKLNTDLQGVIDEWATSLFKEMNYIDEAKNGIKFKEYFGNINDVIIPKMYLNYTTKKVLVMEWIDGQRLSETNDLKLIEVGVYCSLSQIFDYGFYHADPHLGNLLMTNDNKLAYLDFGMMGEINQELRENLISSCIHLVNREFEYLANDFVKLGFIPSNQKMDDVSFALTQVFQNVTKYGIRNISFSNLSQDLGKTMYKFKFRIPTYFFLIIRSLTVLEGIALGKERNFRVLSSAYPWIANKIIVDKSPLLRNTLKNVIYKDGRLRIERLENLLKESSRPMFGSGNQIQSMEDDEMNKKFIKKLMLFILSADGEFIREILIDESSKGIDALNRKALEEGLFALSSRISILRNFNFELFDEEDDYELQNLISLLHFLSNGAFTLNTSINSEFKWQDALTLPVNLTQTIFRSPIVETFIQLPMDAQQNALKIPFEISNKFVSRNVARIIRNSLPDNNEKKNNII